LLLHIFIQHGKPLANRKAREKARTPTHPTHKQTKPNQRFINNKNILYQLVRMVRKGKAVLVTPTPSDDGEAETEKAKGYHPSANCYSQQQPPVEQQQLPVEIHKNQQNSKNNFKPPPRRPESPVLTQPRQGIRNQSKINNNKAVKRGNKDEDEDEDSKHKHNA
jgi:hypothetical protein